MFRFQITTQTVEKAEEFMETVLAEDTSVEEWTYDNSETEGCYTEVYGFGITHYLPKDLEQVASSLGVALIYVESEAEIDKRVDALLEKLDKNVNHDTND